MRPAASLTVASNASVRRPPILYESTICSSSARGVARGLEVVRCDRDLDLRREAAQTNERLLDLGERASHPRDGGVDLALGEAKERVSGLRCAAQLLGRRVRLLRPGEVAAATPDLTDLVVAAGGHGAVEVVDLLACRDRLRLGLGPLAAQAHDLGAVDPTHAGEAADVEPVAPPVRDLRPLRGASEVAEVLAGADRRAVDDPGRERT